MTRNAPRIGSFCLSLTLALLIGGCGGGSSGSTTTSTPATTAAQASTTTATAVTAPVLHLSVLSPHAGAHTGSTVTVHVALSGAPSGDTQRVRYVLDDRLSRSGSRTLTFHDLAPGRHHVEVLVGHGGGAHASTTFIVRAPAPAVVPAVVPAPAEVRPTTATPPPTTSMPEAVHTTPKAPPAKASPPESSGGIPQGGGDGDGDNSGGPSDGDGNI